ncbi:MAG: cobyric acid synthase [Lachnospiraceae bacterium]|nr:cobyric acid synthase [Lachnospiraceae bacterium]
MTEGLQTQNLTIGYDTDLVKDICIKAVPGTVTTLIGPNGCGKSTLLKTLTGELKKKGGTVLIGDTDMSMMKASEIASKLAMLMTASVKPELMTCREVVETGRYPYTGFLGILSEEDKKITQRVIEETGLQDIADREFLNVSDGQRQRVMLSRAICQMPEILVLDEPTSYLDIRYKVDILENIKRLACDNKLTVIMSLHELDIAMKISDFVVAMGEWCVKRTGTPTEVFEERFIRELYGIRNMDIGLLGNMPWISPDELSLSTDGDVPVLSLLTNEKTGRKESAENESVSESVLSSLTEKNAECKEIEENISDGSDVLSSSINIDEKFTDASLNASSKSDKIVSTQKKYAEGGDKLQKTSKRKGAVAVMVQGTMSNAGKSLIAAGLCRVFSRDGYRVAPFKSQNMALNSFITEEGLEMGRAQVVQAECAGVKPDVNMNPVLLKPTNDTGSQVIIKGKVSGNMSATEYFKHKKELIPKIMSSYEYLKANNDIIVIEGAGSPVELNLKKDDIVNMGLAEMTDASVILVGDIDRGGIFPQLLGTLELLEDKERNRVKGLIVNKFRGDISLFDEGVKILEEKGHKKVLGVVPFMDINIEDEDSLTERFEKREEKNFDIAVIKLPHISNFTDFYVFEEIKEVSVRYVTKQEDIGNPDILIIPGTKNTIFDLRWLKEKGLDKKIISLYKGETVIFGICGGYQMLGNSISDPFNVEQGESEEGLGLLDVDTVMEEEKVRTSFEGIITDATGCLKNIKDCKVNGYEIHMGRTACKGDLKEFTSNQTGYCRGNVFGSYVHGLFDNKEIFTGIIKAVAGKNSKTVDTKDCIDWYMYKKSQYDKLADCIRNSLDIKGIYEMMGL